MAKKHIKIFNFTNYQEIKINTTIGDSYVGTSM